MTTAGASGRTPLAGSMWNTAMARWPVFATPTRTALWVLAILIAIDLGSILVESVISLMLEADPYLDRAQFGPIRLDAEFGLWATIGYCKLAVALGLLLAVNRASGARAYLFLAAIFAIMLSDDALLIHERFGRLMATIVDTSSLSATIGIEAAQIWEAAYFLMVGPIVLGLAGWAVISAGTRHRANTVILGFLVLMIGFFAFLMDIADRIVDAYSRYASKLLGLMDDGGENMVVSVAIAFLMMILARIRRSPAKELESTYAVAR